MDLVYIFMNLLYFFMNLLYIYSARILLVKFKIYEFTHVFTI